MKFALWDTETTGLPKHFRSDFSKQPHIIEFAGIITDGKTIFDQIEFKCNPGIPLEDIITKITGITDADLEDEPAFGHFLPNVKKFFSQADATVSHNLSFDEGRLDDELRRIDLKLNCIDYPEIRLCTVEQTAPLFGRPMKLIELYRHYVGEYEQKHRALDDVMRLDQVCKAVGLYDAFKRGMA